MRYNFFILIISGLLLLMVGFGAFFLVQIQNEIEEPIVPNQVTDRQAPSVVSIVQEPAISPILSFDNEKLWYLTKSGQLYRLFLDSLAKEEYPIPVIEGSPIKVIWQEQGSDFIVEFLQAGHRRYSLYDAEEETLTFYPEQMRGLGFLARGEEIVYDWVREDGVHELKVSGKTSENFQTVTELFRGDYDITPSPADRKAILTVSSESAPEKMFLVDLDTGEFMEVSDAAARRDVRYSPDGSMLLVNEIVTGSAKGELVLYKLSDFSRMPLGFFGDRISVSWSDDSETIFVIDSAALSAVNVSSLQKSTLQSISRQLSVEPRDLVVHSNNRKFFFVDELTGFVYQISL